jgi:hypothetical protein
MGILLSYDVSTTHRIVKDELIKRGYLDFFVFQDHNYYLPNRTLWTDREGKTPEKVLTDLQLAIDHINQIRGKKITLERAVTVTFTQEMKQWAAIIGTPSVR